MTLTSWCAPFCLPSCLPHCAVRPFESCQVICQQSESVQAASCRKLLRCSALHLSLFLPLSLSFSLPCSSLGRSHSLPQAASCRRIVSYIKWLVSMLVSPLAPAPLRLSAMLRRLHSLSSTACLGQHDVASSVRRRFGAAFCAVCAA